MKRTALCGFALTDSGRRWILPERPRVPLQLFFWTVVVLFGFCVQTVWSQSNTNNIASLNFRNRQVSVRGQVTQSLSANSGLGPPGSGEPVPIPGGDVVPPLIHNFLPGPISLGFDGIDVEPNGITNFRGFAAQTTLAGTARGSDGKTYNLVSDMRVFQGEYVSVDGTHHRGTFVLI